MGGIWESLVQSVKRCLKVIIRNKLFTAESLATFIGEVEPIINQRSIVPVSDDVNDFEALTPNHFIIGSDCYNFSPGVFEKQEINFCWKWSSVQVAADLFRDRRKREYLSTLNVPRKWTSRYRNFQVGDLVVIPTKDLPRSYWPMGRITEVYPGSDRVVRSVKLKTKKGEFIRPSALLYLLEGVE